MKATKRLQKFIAYGKAWCSSENRWQYLKVAFEAENRSAARAALGGVIRRESERLKLTEWHAQQVIPFPSMH